MTTQLVQLERVLQDLASEFATRLVAEVVRARVAEVSSTLRDGALVGDAAFLVGPAPSSTGAATSTRPPKAKSAAKPRVFGAARPVVPDPSHGLLPGQTRRGGGRQRERSEESEETGADVANLITDPALLLDGIFSGRSSATPLPARAEATEAVRAAALLGDEAPGSSSPSAHHSPALRPGERFLRTAAGHVVLRRGAP